MIFQFDGRPDMLDDGLGSAQPEESQEPESGFGNDFAAVLPDRWVRDQRAKFGLSLLSLLPRERITNMHRHAVFGPISPEEVGFPAESREYLDHCMSFSPALLEALCDEQNRTVLQDWDEHLPVWREALDLLVGNGKQSPLAAGKMMANRLLRGAITAAQVRRIARRELGVEWPKDIDTRLTKLAVRLRGRSTRHQAKLEALARFREMDVPPRWALVENALLQRLFSWPLLILMERGGTAKQSLVLPVTVDTLLGADDAKAKLRPTSTSDPTMGLEPSTDGCLGGDDHMFRFEGTGIIDTRKWHKPAADGRFAAVELWKNKHGTWGGPLKAAVKSAKLHIDVRYAEEIVAPFLHSSFLHGDVEGEHQSMDFEDESLGVYLALISFGHLLGKPHMGDICATGVLVPGVIDREGGSDAAVESPEELDMKVDGVLKLRFFDKCIVPEEGHQSHRHLQICVADRLSRVASHAFGQWSHHRYVRCPELAWAFKDRDHDGGSKVDAILDILDANRDQAGDPVVWMPSEFGPMDIARALKRVNDNAASRAQRLRKNPKRHLGSYTFIRMVPDEVNERFWHTVWTVLNASDESFLDFCFSVSRDGPSRILTKQLNQFHPTKHSIQRAPDVLVIITPKGHGAANLEFPLGPFSRLHLANVLAGLKLYPTSEVRGVFRQIGRTRIIVVEDDQEATSSREPLSDEMAKSGDHLKRLSVYRHGFTFQMARDLLRLNEAQLSKLLENLSQAKGKEEPLLRFPEGANEYYLTRRYGLASLDGEELAALHYDAANSIVGFLERTGETDWVYSQRFNYDEALAPMWLHEAQWHLEQASELTSGQHRYAAEGNERISRIGEFLGWTRLRWVERSNLGTEEVLTGLWQQVSHFRRRNPRTMLHPCEYTMMARLSFGLMRQRTSVFYESLAEDGLHWSDLMHQADMACGNPELSPSERAMCQSRIATTRACFLMKLQPDFSGLTAARADIDRAIGVPNYQATVEEPEWFEFLGDRYGFARAREAAAFYRQGILNPAVPVASGMRSQTLIKYLGACAQAKLLADAEVVAELQRLGKAAIRHTRKLKTGLHRLDHIHNRWAAGRKYFYELRSE